MLIFPTEQIPPRPDKPHICADMQSIVFSTFRGNRIGFAEEDCVFQVAISVLEYMQREGR